MLKLNISDLLIDAKRWGARGNAHTVGWVVEYHGEEYGDFVTITDEVLTDQILQECADILSQQMNDSMIQIIGEEFVKMTGSDWKVFAMTEMELKKEVADSINILKE